MNLPVILDRNVVEPAPKQVPRCSVAPVEPPGVRAEQISHSRRDALGWRFCEEVHMVRHEAVAKRCPVVPGCRVAEHREKRSPIRVVHEDDSAIVAPGGDVLEERSPAGAWRSPHADIEARATAAGYASAPDCLGMRQECCTPSLRAEIAPQTGLWMRCLSPGFGPQRRGAPCGAPRYCLCESAQPRAARNSWTIFSPASWPCS